MTRLEANVKDFRLDKDSEGTITHWRFRFDQCEDFHDALKQFKAKIHKNDRKPYPDRYWEWRVYANQANYVHLCEIFDNFQECESGARNQIEMFGQHDG